MKNPAGSSHQGSLKLPFNLPASLVGFRASNCFLIVNAVFFFFDKPESLWIYKIHFTIVHTLHTLYITYNTFFASTDFCTKIITILKWNLIKYKESY